MLSHKNGHHLIDLNETRPYSQKTAHIIHLFLLNN